MEILKTLFGNKKYVANKKGRRVTAKYDVIDLYEHRKVVVAVCRNHYGKRLRKIHFWDKVTEKTLDYGKVESYTRLENGMFALKSEGELVIYDSTGSYLRRDITYISKCNNTDLYRIKVEDKMYFATSEFTILAGPFLSATDFDMYGYSVVQKDNEQFTVLSKGLKEQFPTVQCEELRPLSKDFFCIRRNGSYGVINLQQKVIIPCIYARIAWQKHNHFELLFNRKLGLANTKGEIVFECLYDEIMETPDKFVVKDFARIESAKTLETKKQD